MALRISFLIWLIIGLVLTSAPKALTQITYNENNLNGLAVWQYAQFQDDSVVLLLAEANSTNCWSSELILRRVNPANGSVSNIPVNYTFQDFNFCQTHFDTQTYGIRIASVARNILLIKYVKAPDANNPTTGAEIRGLMVDFSGNIISDISLGSPYATDQTGLQLNVGLILSSDDPSGGFIFIIDQSATSKTFFWSQFSSIKNDGTMSRLDGNVTEEEKYSKVDSTAFPTQDEGYGLLVVYNTNNNTNNTNNTTTSSSTDFLYRAEVSFFHPIGVDKNVTSVGPFTVWGTNLAGINTIKPVCSRAAHHSLGYTCILRVVTSQNSSYYQSVSFFSSGAIRDVTTLAVDSSVVTTAVSAVNVMDLPFGGYLLTTTSIQTVNTTSPIFQVTGTVISDTGNSQNWGFPNPLTLTNLLRSPLFVAYQQNSSLMAFYASGSQWFFNTTGLPVFYPDNTGFNSRNILSVFPSPGNSVPLGDRVTIKVQYDRLVSLSNADISIYQLNVTDNDNYILRQRCSARTISCDMHISDDTLYLTVWPSTFNTPGATYFVSIDSDFVQDLQFGEPLGGIYNNTWLFTAGKSNDTFSDTSTGKLRLNATGTTYFRSISDQGAFFNDLRAELAMALSVDFNRITTDGRSQNDPSTDRVLIHYTIKKASGQDQRSSKELLGDLDTLIRQKVNTPISFYTKTSYLDETYGVQPTANLWDTYKAKILGLLLVVLFVLALYIMAQIKDRKANNFAIIQIAIIIIGVAVYIAFLINNGHDIEWLYLPSLLFLVIPICLNFLFGFLIFIQEHDKNRRFLNWSNKNAKLVPFFTLLAAADVEALYILGSKVAGIKYFRAPFSEKASFMIFWASTFNMFIAKIPQLIIQVLYQKNTIANDIVPLLTLSFSTIALTVNVLNRVFQIIHYCRSGQFRHVIPTIYEKEYDDPATEKSETVEQSVVTSTNIASVSVHNRGNPNNFAENQPLTSNVIPRDESPESP